MSANLADLNIDFVPVPDSLDQAVANVDDAVGDIKHLQVMSCRDDGDAFSAVEVSYQVNDFTTGNSIKVGCGFVCQDDGRVVCMSNARAMATRWRCPPDSSSGR